MLNFVAIGQTVAEIWWFFDFLRWPPSAIYTCRRSIAERDGCFQRRLFVCQFVCLFVNTITSERLNTVRWNLARRCTAQKSRWISIFGVKGQSSRSPGTKKTKMFGFYSGAVHLAVRCILQKSPPYWKKDKSSYLHNGLTAIAAKFGNVAQIGPLHPIDRYKFTSGLKPTFSQIFPTVDSLSPSRLTKRIIYSYRFF